jgi:hypothetical protein
VSKQKRIEATKEGKKNGPGVAVELLLDEALHSGVRLRRDDAAVRDDNARPCVRRNKLQILRPAVFLAAEPEASAENRERVGRGRRCALLRLFHRCADACNACANRRPRWLLKRTR